MSLKIIIENPNKLKKLKFCFYFNLNQNKKQLKFLIILKISE